MRSFFFILNSRVQYVKIRNFFFHFQLNVICLVVDKIERQRIRKASQSYQGILTAGWFGYRKPKGSYNMGGACWVVGRPPCRVTRQILISGIGYRRRTSVITHCKNGKPQSARCRPIIKCWLDCATRNLSSSSHFQCMLLVTFMNCQHTNAVRGLVQVL